MSGRAWGKQSGCGHHPNRSLQMCIALFSLHIRLWWDLLYHRLFLFQARPRALPHLGCSYPFCTKPISTLFQGISSDLCILYKTVEKVSPRMIMKSRILCSVPPCQSPESLFSIEILNNALSLLTCPKFGFKDNKYGSTSLGQRTVSHEEGGLKTVRTPPSCCRSAKLPPRHLLRRSRVHTFCSCDIHNPSCQ